MKNLFFIVIALFAIGTFTACTDEQDDTLLTCEQSTIISAVEYATATTDAVNIDSLSINENCLSITFSSHSSNSDLWQVRLIDSEDISESLPPQRNLKLLLENEEVFFPLISKTISFDIHELEVENEVSVQLNIFDSGGDVTEILYEY